MGDLLLVYPLSLSVRFRKQDNTPTKLAAESTGNNMGKDLLLAERSCPLLNWNQGFLLLLLSPPPSPRNSANEVETTLFLLNRRHGLVELLQQLCSLRVGLEAFHSRRSTGHDLSFPGRATGGQMVETC